MVTSGGGGEEMPREGYYPDPSIPGYVRYWNGAAWVPGTSRPAPTPGEVLAPPPAAAKSTAGPVTPQVLPRTPAVDESGPMFLDEDPAAPVAETPPGPAWVADPARQSGVGDAARRVKWGADGPATPEAATPVAPEGPASGGAPGTAGSAASEGAPAGPGGQPAAGGYGFPPQGSGDSAAPGGGAGPQAAGGSAGMPAAGVGPASAGAAPASGGAPGGFGQPPAMGGAVAGGGAAQAGGASGGPPAAGGYGYPQAAAGGGAPAPVSHGGPPAAGGPGVGPQAAGGQPGAGAAYAYPPQAPVGGGYGYPQAGSDPVPWQRQVQELAGDSGAAPSQAVPWRPPVSNPFLQAQEQARPAATGRRLAARVIDSLLVGAVVAGGAFPLVMASVRHIQDKIDAARQSGENVQVWLIDGTTGLYLGIILGALLLAGLLYEVLPTVKWGRTLGKKLFKLRVLDIESQLTPGFGQALRRLLVRLLLDLVVVGLVNLAWCLFDRPWRQCWHDKAARTFVAGGG